ncbi:MAG: DUF2330 domain-containing protein [Vicinamibacterales bacterium]
MPRAADTGTFSGSDLIAGGSTWADRRALARVGHAGRRLAEGALRLSRTGRQLTDDPRHWQMGVQVTLLVIGLGWLDFDLSLAQVVVTLGAALATQMVADALTRRRLVWPTSAVISALSLCLLLRTSDLMLAALASIVAIGSKFVCRVRGKHIFNPSNLAIASLLFATDAVWLSPGQWGATTLLASAIACAGGTVLVRASRSDITYAFLAFYGSLLVGRALSLGDPMTIPWHRVQTGSLLLFAFFMLSDPKTTPDARRGRVVFAALVALVGFYFQTRRFDPNALQWALVLCSPVVPVLDRVFPGEPYAWSGRPDDIGRQRRWWRVFRRENAGSTVRRDTTVRRFWAAVAAALAVGTVAPTLSAFCGFYVAKADTRLFNKASQVVLVRDGERTVITMANDFKGDLTQFAVVVPVPTFIERGQIHVGDKAVLEHLDAYTAPRLVEYFDDNPCATFDRNTSGSVLPAAAPMMQWRAAQAAEQTMGVKIEASYTVGEYDILILSATQSSGLATWLRDNGYRIPPGAAEVLGSYIRQNMRFFVAKVNVTEQVRLGFSMLRPLQVAYESPKFMLPIRLGMVNADGPQELFVYALTKNGRVETTNYRTVKLSTGLELPPYVKESDEFGRMYKALFSEQVRRENMSAVFLEYAWDMSSCDPCAAEPLTSDELRRLGVFWAGDGAFSARRGSAGGVFVSRLHVRYDQAHFPEDLMLQETGDQAPFQGRYIVRHPWQGGDTCSGATTYRRELRTRQEREAQTLASATGWRLAEVRKRMGLDDRPGAAPASPWWQLLWR